MVLNRSWPAVSQICSFTRLPSMVTVLILKSMPMVVMNVGENEWLAYRINRLVFPTPVVCKGARRGVHTATCQRTGACGKLEAHTRPRRGASLARGAMAADRGPPGAWTHHCCQ